MNIYNKVQNMSNSKYFKELFNNANVIEKMNLFRSKIVDLYNDMMDNFSEHPSDILNFYQKSKEFFDEEILVIDLTTLKLTMEEVYFTEFTTSSIQPAGEVKRYKLSFQMKYYNVHYNVSIDDEININPV